MLNTITQSIKVTWREATWLGSAITNQSLNQSLNQAMNQSMNTSNQSINQSIKVTWRESTGSGRGITQPRVSVALQPSAQVWTVVASCEWWWWWWWSWCWWWWWWWSPYVWTVVFTCEGGDYDDDDGHDVDVDEDDYGVDEPQLRSICRHMLLFRFFVMSIKTLHYALSPYGIRKLGTFQNYDLDSHFLRPQLFQMKIFGCFLLNSVTFNLYLGTSWKESSAAVKIANKSVTIQTGCGKYGNKIKRTSWAVWNFWSPKFSLLNA